MNDFPNRGIEPLAAGSGAYDALLDTVRSRKRRKAALVSGTAVVLAVAVGASTAGLTGGSSSAGGPETLAVATPTAEPDATTSPEAEPTPAPSVPLSPSPSATPSPTAVTTTSAPRSQPTSAAPSATAATTTSPPALAPCTPRAARITDARHQPLSGAAVRGDGSPTLGSSFGDDIATTGAGGAFTVPAGATFLNVGYQGSRNVVSRWFDLAHPVCAADDPRADDRVDYVLVDGAVLQGTITVEPCLSVTAPDDAYWAHYQGRGLWAPRIRFTQVDAHTFTFRAEQIPPTRHRGSWESAAFAVAGSDDPLLRYFDGDDLPPLVDGAYTVNQHLTTQDLRSHDGRATIPASCAASPTPSASPTGAVAP